MTLTPLPPAPRFRPLRAALTFACALGTFSVAASACAASAAAADRLLTRAAEQERTRAFAAAAESYCEAARLGAAQALYRLGTMYGFGLGVERDNQVSASLLALAAEQGHEGAKRLLAPLTTDTKRLPECITDPEGARRRALEKALPDPAANAGPAKRKIVELVRRLAPKYAVDPRLALTLIAVESDFNAAALSPKNAAGLMQLIPDTAERFRVRDAFDPEQNIRGGLAYLRWLLAYFRGDVALAAAAYNAGEGAVDRYRGIPPYAETRDYVRRVLDLYRLERHPFNSAITDPSPALRAPKTVEG